MSNVEYVSRNKNIDFLRAVAILLVMVVHFPRLRQFLPLLNPWSGEDLFFAISGFVVATSFVPQVDIALDKSIGDKKTEILNKVTNLKSTTSDFIMQKI